MHFDITLVNVQVDWQVLVMINSVGWNNDKYRCKCNEFIDIGKFISYPNICEYEWQIMWCLDYENHENIYIMKTVNVERDWLIN